MEKPTILQIPRRFTKQEWGGTESVILHTSQELARRGYEVRILTSDLLSVPGEEIVDGLKVCRFHGFYPRWGLSADARKQLDIRGKLLLPRTFPCNPDGKKPESGSPAHRRSDRGNGPPCRQTVRSPLCDQHSRRTGGSAQRADEPASRSPERNFQLGQDSGNPSPGKPGSRRCRRHHLARRKRTAKTSGTVSAYPCGGSSERSGLQTFCLGRRCRVPQKVPAWKRTADSLCRQFPQAEKSDDFIRSLCLAPQDLHARRQACFDRSRL